MPTSETGPVLDVSPSVPRHDAMHSHHSQSFVPSLVLCLVALAGLIGCEQAEPDGPQGPAPVVRDVGMQTDVGALGPRPDTGPDEPVDMDPERAVDQGVEVDMAPPAACADGVDNDGDGAIDHPADPGCEGPDDDDEVDPIVLPECGDGVDNDGDGDIDLTDGDCLSADDPRERGGANDADCGNGVDDDGDGLVDFPNDPGCSGAGDPDERDGADVPACANGEDDDGDGRIDFPDDPGCQGRGDDDESEPPVVPACGNGEDDDGNGAIDFPADPGCDSAADPDESNPCGAVQLIDLNAAIDADGVYDGTLADLETTTVGTCGGRAGGEIAFLWRFDRLVERLTFTTDHPETTAPTVLYVRRRCDEPDLGCNRGTDDAPGTSVTLERPQPGVYFVIVDTGSRDVIGDFRLTVEVEYPPECRDAIDNDEDGLTDRDDPGCAEFDDPDELDPAEPPVCSNGLDDDGDGLLDYPADDECLTAGFDREQPLCDLPIPFVAIGQEGGRFDLDAPAEGAQSLAQGTCGGFGTAEGVLVVTLDDPSDVAIRTYFGDAEVQVPLYVRTDCLDADSEIACRGQGQAGPIALANADRGIYYVLVEQDPALGAVPLTVEVEIISNIRECNDLIDNDGDGRLDLADPGCVEGLDDSEADPPEVPECADGQDNDGDGAIDWPDDDGCTGAGDTGETPLCMFNPDVIEVGPNGGQVQYVSAGQPSVGRGGCGGGGPQAVVAITIRQPSALTATIIDRDYDTLIFLRAVCDDANTEIACNDDANGLASAINVARLEAGTYFLFLDGFGGGAGRGTVDIVVRPL